MCVRYSSRETRNEGLVGCRLPGSQITNDQLAGFPRQRPLKRNGRRREYGRDNECECRKSATSRHDCPAHPAPPGLFRGTGVWICRRPHPRFGHDFDDVSGSERRKPVCTNPHQPGRRPSNDREFHQVLFQDTRVEIIADRRRQGPTRHFCLRDERIELLDPSFTSDMSIGDELRLLSINIDDPLLQIGNRGRRSFQRPLLSSTSLWAL